ncbi:MAG: bifunctional proline dehydrogenase/L-glutamate gamma-semialdehyde dehydrogenase PutA [Sneathiellales bacterium]|nr:bifunctional proline dehydrogenase/L-glutamate gamma-semialdehyde dehydrogenase PutA [Sneathiellales bacterium]
MPSPENWDTEIRTIIRDFHISDEDQNIKNLIQYLGLKEETREQCVEDAATLVKTLRRQKNPGLMETFLGEYGLSTEEGVALMCLAEALLRVPDEATIDVLIRDKIAPANWGKHLGHSASPLVNVSTWALMLTGKVISPKEAENWDVVGNIRHLLKRAGEPVIRKAVAQSMKILGHQFVLGRDIEEAKQRARGMEEKNYQYSYDMLGEAARTAEDAQKYFLSYSKAIAGISEAATQTDIRDNPGISVKLSALHPRYEFLQRERVMEELVPRVQSLALQAKNARMGFNIDAEEADRLDLSLDVIEAVFSEPDLAGWDGFGVVVQAYGPRSFYVLDWCHALAKRLKRRMMIRLVKGAYWDTEIKQAQVEGFEGYPVFTRKAATDISYMACAKKLLSMTDYVYPQFATHNAHTMTAILALAGKETNYEFQRLHGMGEGLHDLVKDQNKTRCRIYAPVGVHEDLLAYLVRRLLENGANSSFVNQVLDEKVPAREVVKDPIKQLDVVRRSSNFSLEKPVNMFPDGRRNSEGVNFSNPKILEEYQQAREIWKNSTWKANPIVAGKVIEGEGQPVRNPAEVEDQVGATVRASTEIIENAFDEAQKGQEAWATEPASQRGQILEKIADLYETNRNELMSLLCREAGKSLMDALNEVREAVDFCRFYAREAQTAAVKSSGEAHGVFVCISPWNFPLAIFTGQIVAALATGNAVLAKPAEQTPLVAAAAVRLMHKAGIPVSVLHLLPGPGAVVGQAMVSHPAVGGVCFTGSTATAQRIAKTMAETSSASAPLIAETGGLNAMIVDSTALPEQAVRDVVASAFQSAGQRCSALRILYVQEDVAEKILHMLKGAMEELVITEPWELGCDVGPVIDPPAQQSIQHYCDDLEAKGRLLKKLSLPDGLNGTYVAPTLLKVSGIEEMEREIFGPVLHFATYKAEDLSRVIDSINKSGYGLTMGLHTRVDGRVQEVADMAKVGNLYVNRNQIGAVVGVQPFGGEGLSGTGPKAGGPLYLHKFVGHKFSGSHDDLLNGRSGVKKALVMPTISTTDVLNWQLKKDTVKWVKSLFKEGQEFTGLNWQDLEPYFAGFDPSVTTLPGPTGESNQLQIVARGTILVTGRNWLQDVLLSLITGNAVLLVTEERENADRLHALLKQSNLPHSLLHILEMKDLPVLLADFPDLAAVALSTSETDARQIRLLLAEREGALVPVLDGKKGWREFVHERTLSIDTTASGGNAALLAMVDG